MSLVVNEVLARKPKRRADWLQKKLREEAQQPGLHAYRDLLYEVLTRKEGRSFVSDFTSADAVRAYSAVLVALELFTARQQRVLKADKFILRQLFLQEEKLQAKREEPFAVCRSSSSSLKSTSMPIVVASVPSEVVDVTSPVLRPAAAPDAEVSPLCGLPAAPLKQPRTGSRLPQIAASKPRVEELCERAAFAPPPLFLEPSLVLQVTAPLLALTLESCSLPSVSALLEERPADDTESVGPAQIDTTLLSSQESAALPTLCSQQAPPEVEPSGQILAGTQHEQHLQVFRSKKRQKAQSWTSEHVTIASKRARPREVAIVEDDVCSSGGNPTVAVSEEEPSRNRRPSQRKQGRPLREQQTVEVVAGSAPESATTPAAARGAPKRPRSSPAAAETRPCPAAALGKASPFDATEAGTAAADHRESEAGGPNRRCEVDTESGKVGPARVFGLPVSASTSATKGGVLPTVPVVSPDCSARVSEASAVEVIEDDLRQKLEAKRRELQQLRDRLLRACARLPRAPMELTPPMPSLSSPPISSAVLCPAPRRKADLLLLQQRLRAERRRLERLVARRGRLKETLVAPRLRLEAPAAPLNLTAAKVKGLCEHVVAGQRAGQRSTTKSIAGSRCQTAKQTNKMSAAVVEVLDD